jgi:hypothetical protein
MWRGIDRVATAHDLTAPWGRNLVLWQWMGILWRTKYHCFSTEFSFWGFRFRLPVLVFFSFLKTKPPANALSSVFRGHSSRELSPSDTVSRVFFFPPENSRNLWMTYGDSQLRPTPLCPSRHTLWPCFSLCFLRSYPRYGLLNVVMHLYN